MTSREDIETMVLGMPSSVKDYPFGEHVGVYFVESGKLDDKQVAGDQEKQNASEQTPNRKMFAIIDEESMPVRISLKCDPQLSELLRAKYESVLPGYHLSKRHWNTVICSGQLDDQEIKDLIRHSYELVTVGP